MKFDWAKPSPLRVCFTGKNKAGSWQIRGEQIAAGRTNWETLQPLRKTDLKRFDLVCIVKKPERDALEALRAADVPFVYDIVDSWLQPDDGLVCGTPAAARELFRKKWESIGADSYIFPNRMMRTHMGGLVPHSITIYHHHWPMIRPVSIRPKVATVAYEGNATYLGHWSTTMRALCDRKGIRFEVNPEDWERVDIGLAARGGEHDSFLSNMYKSNVKLANFYGRGLPCLVSAKEASYHETDNGYVRFFSDERTLERQLDALMPFEERSEVHKAFIETSKAFHPSVICDIYDDYFQDVRRVWRQGRRGSRC